MARDVFSDLGYEKASFMEIAHRAGVTRPAVNHYFGSKEALYGALFDATRDSVVDAGVANAMNEHKLTRQIGAFLEAAAQVDSRDRTHARFIAASVLDSVRHPELNDRALGQLAEVRVFLEQALRTAIERGEIRHDLDITAVTEMLIAILWGMGLYAGYVGTHQQLDSVVQQFTRLLEGDLW
ncbi:MULTISPECIES: TetR/AcrR family transcriptional regulator [unclassified Pseudonocardia]|uniref:TetR/AcrR family transcriptional regulator n=1 Tax=unclassified Pseudonocardia TaxID=2619320 RepID=UPI0001FFE560|nr:TetR/AcrR family transcriptional regulator [Pseudonocardia sp. Ae707_Ps1]OLM16728.1 Transcriptional regulator, TetR family [Pseudonocardia sp. Ae707_Ps1]